MFYTYRDATGNVVETIKTKTRERADEIMLGLHGNQIEYLDVEETQDDPANGGKQ